MKENEYRTRTKHRTEKEKKSLKNRLSIIEGQVRGVKQMIEDDRYCDEVIIQISAIEKSLKSIGNEIIRAHIISCYSKGLKVEKEQIAKEILELFKNAN